MIIMMVMIEELGRMKVVFVESVRIGCFLGPETYSCPELEEEERDAPFFDSNLSLSLPLFIF